MAAKAKAKPLAMGQGNASGFWDFSEAVDLLQLAVLRPASPG